MTSVFIAGVAGVVTGMWLLRKEPSAAQERVMVSALAPAGAALASYP